LTDRPFLLVVAGPNGSGKSTLTKYLLDAGIELGIYINPDDIAQTIDLPEPQRSMQAQAIADFKRDACLQRRDSFSFETVMSHPSKVEVMIRAYDAGYDVSLFFVATSDPEINVRRVENRVSAGGHDVPHDRIRARYYRSLDLLSYGALVARRTVVFDNSALVGNSPHSQLVNVKNGMRPVAEVVRLDNHYRISVEADVPQWVFDHLLVPLDRVARLSEGGITVLVQQNEGPLC
jgi:predicted ABC-type ATPase